MATPNPHDPAVLFQALSSTDIGVIHILHSVQSGQTGLYRPPLRSIYII